MVIEFVPCPEIIVPILENGAANDQVIISPGGRFPPDNVYEAVPSTQTLSGPLILPTVACTTFKVTGLGHPGFPFRCNTTEIVPAKAVHFIVAVLPVVVVRLPG